MLATVTLKAAWGPQLASPEVVAASALAGRISEPGWYKAPADYAGVSLGEGDGIKEEDRMMTIEDMLEKAIKQADEIIESEERNLNGLANSSKDDSTTQPSTSAPETLTDILPSFPEKVTGEIVSSPAPSSPQQQINEPAQNRESLDSPPWDR